MSLAETRGPGPTSTERARELIARHKRAERSVGVCMSADLREEMSQLARQLSKVEEERRASGSLASGSKSRELAERLAELSSEMEESTVWFRLRAMTKREWRALKVANPPRAEVESDVLYGGNEDALFEAAIPKSCVEPELSAEEWKELLDDLSAAEWGALRDAVVMLNDTDVDVPFSRTALAILQRSDDTSP